MRTILVITALALSLAPTAVAQQKDANFYFKTPSGNIECRYLARIAFYLPSLRCEIGTGLKPMPPRPAKCRTDYGFGTSLLSTGKGEPLCAGDVMAEPGQHFVVLAYGHTWRHNGFVCSSTEAGLTCTNAKHHGFFLSRERWRVF